MAPKVFHFSPRAFSRGFTSFGPVIEGCFLHDAHQGTYPYRVVAAISPECVFVRKGANHSFADRNGNFNEGSHD
jgi:hypothetical protein